MENLINDTTLSQNEYCYLAEHKQHYSNSSFKVIVPKLMSNISGGGNRTYSTYWYNNDPSCGISFSGSVPTQKYITVPRSPNCSLAHKADKYGYIHVGTQLTCLCMNSNVKDLIIVDSV